jgi:hypothetical protein
LCGAEISAYREADQKYLESFEMWCWERMEKISRTERARNEEVLHRVEEDRNIQHTIKRRADNRIGCILRRNGLLKHVIQGQIKDGSDGRRREKR